MYVYTRALEDTALCASGAAMTCFEPLYPSLQSYFSGWQHILMFQKWLLSYLDCLGLDC